MASESDLATLLGLTGVGGSGSLGDINNFKKTVAEGDPYNIALAPIATAKFNTSTWSPASTAAVYAGQGFLGSILKGLSDQDVEAQLGKLTSVMPQLNSDPYNTPVPEGVDSEAFNTYKLGIAAKKEATNENIRQALANAGLTYDGTSVSELPATNGKTATELITEAALAKKTQSATASRATLGLSEDLSKMIAGVAALNTAKKDVSDFYGARTFGTDSTIGGAIDYLGKFIPNTNAYQYNKDLPTLNDPVTQGIAGATKQGTLIQNKPMLSQDFGQTADSMAATDDKTAAEISAKIASQIAVLQTAGWPENGPVKTPDGRVLPSLSDYRQMYDNISQGGGLPKSVPTSPVVDSGGPYQIGGSFNGEKITGIRKIK